MKYIEKEAKVLLPILKSLSFLGSLSCHQTTNDRTILLLNIPRVLCFTIFICGKAKITTLSRYMYILKLKISLNCNILIAMHKTILMELLANEKREDNMPNFIYISKIRI